MTRAEALVEDLKRPWRHGEHVDARGVVLGEPLVLDGLEVRGFDLSNAVLKGGLSARGTHFQGLSWLRSATVRGACDLKGARFRTDLRADGLRTTKVDLDDSLLQGVLSLAAVKLDSLALRGALVMANVTMEAAEIGEVDLSAAELMGGLWFPGARIGALRNDGAEISGRVRLPA